MYIYNITSKVDWQIHNAWLQWIKEFFLPEMLNTGCFKEYRIVKLLEVDETDGPTYAIQLTAVHIADYNRYQEIFAATLNRKYLSMWGEKVVSFSSLMQIVH